MPVAKSLSDLAWEAFSAAARSLVTAKTYRTYEALREGTFDSRQ